jgi:pimeloyl-ACP methyl ester carboxylesterase
MGTDQAIQDLDLLRQALHHDKMNYLGWSYGTQFGTEYAEKFPDKVGRMVLDGVYDRHLSLETYLSTGAVGSETTLEDFFRWCNTTTDCALYGRDQAAIWDGVAAAADAGTLRVQSCAGVPCANNGIVAPWQFRGLLYSLLHDYDAPSRVHSWYRYAEGLEAAFDSGNGSYFASPPTTANSSALYPQIIILCSDRDNRQFTFDDFRNFYTLAPVWAPHTLGYSFAQQTVALCSGWPVDSTNPPHDLDPQRMSQLPPVMMVNSFYDPATVSPWGLAMRSQVPTAFSIYRNGGGHTSWALNGDTTKAINAFLVNGTIPADGTVYQT